MLKRIELVLQTQNLTVSQFADRIGVQRSALSHVLAGRNNPSLDFVTKILRTFPDIRSQWLLFGEGKMYDSLAGVRSASPVEEMVDFSPEKAVGTEREMPHAGLAEPEVGAAERTDRRSALETAGLPAGGEAVPMGLVEPVSTGAEVAGIGNGRETVGDAAQSDGDTAHRGVGAARQDVPVGLPDLPVDFGPAARQDPALVKVVFFYSDGHFEEYAPRETPRL